MWHKIVIVYFSSMVKFIFGPASGYGLGLNLLTTVLATVAGMMTVVLAFAFFGGWLRSKIIHKFFKNRKKFSVRNRRFVTIWKKYGVAGVAALTPLLFTPIGGAILAVSFGSPRDKLIVYMFISASFWALVFTTAIYLFGNAVIPEFMRPEPPLLE